MSARLAFRRWHTASAVSDMRQPQCTSIRIVQPACMRRRRVERAAAAVAVLIVGFTASLDGQRREDLIRIVGQTISGRTVSVADGDTVRIRLDGTNRVIRVRLEGIDAPEIGEPFSNQARIAARVLMFDRKVQVKATDVDNYDRLVARVIVDGKDSSIELLEAGLACHFTRFENDAVLAKAQLDARTNGKGFWAAGAPKPQCVKFTMRPPPSGRR